MKQRFKFMIFLIGGALLLGALPFLFYSQSSAGQVACGDVRVATVAMPHRGDNFSPYCLPCIAALRTFARVPVIATLSGAFHDMQKVRPKSHFVYGEIGFPNGGRFRPHKTHREGLSVDLMVPLKDGKILSTTALNRFGYDVAFDGEGKNAEGAIDFAALADLIAAIDQQSRQRGGRIRRIFFAPDLQPHLFRIAPSLRKAIKFNKRQSWVRHDEHIHIDFKFPCESP